MSKVFEDEIQGEFEARKEAVLEVRRLRTAKSNEEIADENKLITILQ